MLLSQTYKPEISPTEYVDRSNSKHQDWVKKTFNYTKKYKNPNDMFKHQRIVRDYMQLQSPYRGILLYHGLGTGKTRSSIAISELFVNKKKVIIMLPATLQNNYYQELYKYGNELYLKQRYWTRDSKSNEWIASQDSASNYSSLSVNEKTEIDELINGYIRKRVSFIRYNGLTIDKFKVMLEKNENMFKNTVIIIDEVHNFISKVTNGSIICKHIYKMILDATDIKLVCLSGTPLINYAQEFILLINLVSGYIEKYKINCKKTTFKHIDIIINKLENDLRVKSYFIDNEKHEITIQLLPNNYIKKSIDKPGVWIYKNNLIHNIDDIVENLDINLKKAGVEYKKLSALPLNEPDLMQQMRKLVLETDQFKDDILKIKKTYISVIQGLVSYFYYYDPLEYPKLNKINIEEIPMSNEQFNSYIIARKIEYKNENPPFNKKPKSKIKKTMFYDMNFDNKKSCEFCYFKVFSRSISNYVFPDLQKIKIDKKLDTTSFFNQATKLGYLSPGNLDKYAPKIKKILENMKNSNGPCLIYSQYRTIEGLGALSKVLENDGYSEITVRKSKGQLHLITDSSADSKHFIVFSNANVEKIQILMDIFNKNYSNLPVNINKDLQNIQNKNVDVIFITQAGSEGISLKGVRQVHILEPYWNYIRIMQVIGRAVRAKSHLHLNKKDQNVDVFLYTMIFNEKQRKLMEWDKGKLSKQGLTSDQMIYLIAKRKEQMLQHLLTIMKETAMDCKVHLSVHKKTEPDIKCLN